jgi:preprotein translocase subunit SecA
VVANDQRITVCADHLEGVQILADIRRQLWEYDQVLNTQRDKVYMERRRGLLSRDLSPLLLEYAERTVDDILEVCLNSPGPLKSFF